MPSQLKLKPLLAFGGLFVVSLVLSVWFFGQTRKTPRPPLWPVPTGAVGPAPTGWAVPGEPKRVVFSIDSPIPAPPIQLPVYIIRYPANMPGRIERLAAQMGLSNPVLFSPDEQTDKKSWANSDYALAYARDSIVHTLFYQKLKQGTTSSTTTLDSVARDFLFQVIQIPKISLLATNQSQQRLHGAVFTDKPQLTRIEYSFLTPSGYPILFANLDTTSATLSVDKGGTVRIATLVYPPESMLEKEVLSTATLETALTGLNVNRGVLLYVAGGDNKELGPAPGFSSVSVGSMTIAYWLNEQAQELLPVYLFEGIGHGATTQRVLYMIRATE